MNIKLKRTLPISAAMVVTAVLALACSSSQEPTNNIFEQNVPNYSEKADLANLETVEETEQEIIRLLNDGHVMYTRLEIFNKRVFPELDCFEHPGSRPRAVCLSYPERIVSELWESTNSSGTVENRYGRESTLDGETLAISSSPDGGIPVDWVYLETGATWLTGRRADLNLLELVEAMSSTADRVTKGYENVIDGEYLGHPSIVVSEGEFEYQLINPFYFRQTRWSEDENGNQYMLSEGKVVDFAMLPLGSFPDPENSVD